MKKIVTDTLRAVYGKVDPYRRKNCFEVFGYDFMIDENFRLYLIECNTNPCFELTSPLLARIIPAMLDNSFRIALDPIFPPPELSVLKKNVFNDFLPENKFELIFDEKIDGKELKEL
jgi:hypothetical protein